MTATKDPLLEAARRLIRWLKEQTMEDLRFKVISGQTPPTNRKSRTFLASSPRYGDLLRFSIVNDGRHLNCRLYDSSLETKLPKTNRIQDINERAGQFVAKQNEQNWGKNNGSGK